MCWWDCSPYLYTVVRCLNKTVRSLNAWTVLSSGMVYHLCKALLPKVLTTWTSEFKNELSCYFTTPGRWLTSSISLFTRTEALGDVNKVATSPPREADLRAQFSFLPGMRPQVTRKKLSYHHLAEVACELNVALYPGWASGDMNKAATSPPRGGGLRAQSRSLPNWALRWRE